jgi:hypothetical protein
LLVENAMNLLNLNMLRTLRLACAVILMAMMAACGGGGGGPAPDTQFISGTAAVGVPMINATVTEQCADGNTYTGQTDQNGNFIVKAGPGPCLQTATDGTSTVTSIVPPCTCKGQNVNVTPFSTLGVYLLAGRFRTTYNGFISGWRTNRTWWTVVTPVVITQVQTQIITLIQVRYGFVLVPNFWSIVFVTRVNGGLDSQIDTARGDGAFGPDGSPNPDLGNAANQEGEGDEQLGGGSTGGTGSGGSGTVPCGCSA